MARAASGTIRTSRQLLCYCTFMALSSRSSELMSGAASGIVCTNLQLLCYCTFIMVCSRQLALHCGGKMPPPEERSRDQ
eukprot:5718336-Ditylum_brightwellii.AAC.1